MRADFTSGQFRMQLGAHPQVQAAAGGTTSFKFEGHHNNEAAEALMIVVELEACGSVPL